MPFKKTLLCSLLIIPLALLVHNGTAQAKSISPVDINAPAVKVDPNADPPSRPSSIDGVDLTDDPPLWLEEAEKLYPNLFVKYDEFMNNLTPEWNHSTPRIEKEAVRHLVDYVKSNSRYNVKHAYAKKHTDKNGNVYFYNKKYTTGRITKLPDTVDDIQTDWRSEWAYKLGQKDGRKAYRNGHSLVTIADFGYGYRPKGVYDSPASIQRADKKISHWRQYWDFISHQPFTGIYQANFISGFTDAYQTMNVKDHREFNQNMVRRYPIHRYLYGQYMNDNGQWTKALDGVLVANKDKTSRRIVKDYLINRKLPVNKQGALTKQSKAWYRRYYQRRYRVRQYEYPYSSGKRGGQEITFIGTHQRPHQTVKIYWTGIPYTLGLGQNQQ